MRKLLNKNTRFENSIGLINLLFVIVYSVILILNKSLIRYKILKLNYLLLIL